MLSPLPAALFIRLCLLQSYCMAGYSKSTMEHGGTYVPTKPIIAEGRANLVALHSTSSPAARYIPDRTPPFY